MKRLLRVILWLPTLIVRALAAFVGVKSYSEQGELTRANDAITNIPNISPETADKVNRITREALEADPLPRPKSSPPS